MKSLAILLCILIACPALQAQSLPTELNLVVIEGEGATNNVRQRVARDPLVRVEDENHKPVAGAAVVFTLPTEGATGEFGNGAKYIKPDIKYIENYTGDFDDVAKSKEATLAAISQGADIHYHILNLGLRGMEQAAREKNTHIIGSYTDRCGTNPLYVAYTITGVGYQVEYAIDQLVAGTWKAEFKPFGLAMGPKASDIAICTGKTPQMTAKLDEIKKDLLSGKIKVLES